MESSCLFCQIAARQKPAYLIYEDDDYLAFLDLYPYGPGHTLVIPKKHYHRVWDVPDIGGYMETARKIALHLSHQMQTDTVYSLIFGEQVPHAHIHLLPPLPETQARLSQGFLHLRQPQIDPQQAEELSQRLILR